MRALSFAAVLIATLGYSALAQSPAEHQGHHPEQKEVPAAKPVTPPAAPRGSGPSQGPMGGMMGGNMQMPDMMRMMRMMHQSADGMGGMETIDRVEGRIAFLRTELKITDAQGPVRNAFADSLRSSAKALGELRKSMMAGYGSETLVDRLTWQEKWLSARLESTRAMKSALADLFGSFSDEQKKAADELLAPQMGMMSMMQSGRMGMPMHGK
ncbi:Spy/CpxP family protein refolding chaperone [Bradyrhizobium sp. WSM2793]|uniref:Spy/CpxP family protein refolding chaperone n=1 Tax=Bradyrhizobium sp. WSM2793 TaxID=1038866 RepID=UPI000376047C|nr:Spy/CpxP family protein refolding chaperone [Bradyrhizobium sp. WSM2793]